MPTSEKVAHTPGPWTADHGFGDTWSITSTEANEHGYLVAEVQTLADTHLIAAAPDLLAALEHAVARSHGHHPSSCDGCELADKAIAKARGA